MDREDIKRAEMSRGNGKREKNEEDGVKIQSEHVHKNIGSRT